ncbi:MAG: PDZ domain-containing protein [Planctomycetes bacterium]|nr:PDZ domain-containing protein [Planctomycetota bacterium]
MKNGLWMLVAVIVGLAPALWAEERPAETGEARPASRPDASAARVKVVVGENGKVEILEPRAGATAVLVEGSAGQSDAKSGGPWLGVSIRSVSAPLAAQLGLEPGAGVLVANVAEGSPADRVGIRQHDVIVALDGKEIGGGPGEFARWISEMGTGRKIQLSAVQRGEKKDLEVTLEDPPPADSVKYKYPPDSEEVDDDRFNIRSHVFRRGPEGVFEPILPGGEPLDHYGIGISEGGNVELHVHVSSEDGRKSTRVKKVTDGRSIEVESAADGKIKVTRTTKDEDGRDVVSSKEYANAEELKEGDAEAYELLAGTQKKGAMRVLRLPEVLGGKGHVQKFELEIPDLEFHVPKKWMSKDIDEILKDLQIEPNLKKMLESQKLEVEKIKEAAEVARRKILERWEPAWSGEEAETQKVERDFQVQSDGSIKVTVRKEGSSVEYVAKSEEDLKKDHPKLHEHYKKLLEEE